jgi:acyl-CoA thioesterase-1
MKYFLIVLCILSGVAISNASAASAAEAAGTVMVFGDSMSSGYGLPPEAGWVNLLKKRLQTQAPAYRVVNASISGETTLSGRNRIEQALKTHRPAIVIIELGGNDGLRGSSIESIRDNLGAIIEACQRNQAAVLLAGMHLPPNYGISYTQKFQDVYPQLAQRHQLKLLPFLLDGFGDKREFFLTDGIHPNAQAQGKILENVWGVLRTMLKQATAKRSA